MTFFYCIVLEFRYNVIEGKQHLQTFLLSLSSSLLIGQDRTAVNCPRLKTDHAKFRVFRRDCFGVQWKMSAVQVPVKVLVQLVTVGLQCKFGERDNTRRTKRKASKKKPTTKLTKAECYHETL